MTEKIAELANLSAKLNEKSDSLNSTIGSINGKLAGLRLGVEVWLDSPVHSGDYSEDYDDEGRRIDRSREVTLLGYAKVDDVWQLAVKTVTFHTESDAYGREYEETVNPSLATALLKASRDVRAESMRFIPRLLDALRDRAAMLLNAIEQAEAAARKL